MERNISIALILAIVAIALGFFSYRSLFSNENYPYTEIISNIPLYSKIPIEDLHKWKKTAVFKTDNKAGITCNFEISAISSPSVDGNRIEIKKGKEGIYIREKSAVISGSDDIEILNACHVFSCLLANVSCHENFLEIKNLIPYENKMNIVVDEKLSQNGVKAYSEILAAYGFIQAGIVDIDRDRKFSEYEKAINKVFIYPYVKNGDNCTRQKFKNLIQETEGNITLQCEEIDSGIFIQYSNETKIEVREDKIYILGNDDRIQKAAIIVRDIIAPDWIRTLYGM
ncbi:MAG: hypothetical protein QXY62_00840 [Candidatus Altiarchaeota archaeon]